MRERKGWGGEGEKEGRGGGERGSREGEGQSKRRVVEKELHVHVCQYTCTVHCCHLFS